MSLLSVAQARGSPHSLPALPSHCLVGCTALCCSVVETMDYFRAILARNELSPRSVLSLCTDSIHSALIQPRVQQPANTASRPSRLLDSAHLLPSSPCMSAPSVLFFSQRVGSDG